LSPRAAFGRYVPRVRRAGRTFAGFGIGKGLNRSFKRTAISEIAANETVFGDYPRSRKGFVGLGPFAHGAICR